MHISDGVLPPQLWIAGAVGAAVSVAFAIRRFEEHHIPRVAVCTSVFFVASSVHVPVAGVTVHLLLTGLLGIVLGLLSFPSILVGLFLQAILIAHGGITTLGVNTLTMGAGALAARAVFVSLRRWSSGWTLPAAFLAAVSAVVASASVLAAFLSLAGKGIQALAPVYILPNLGLSLLDGLVTMGAVGFLERVKPELLPGRPSPGLASPPMARAAGRSSGTLLLVVGLLLAGRGARAHGLLVDARSRGGEVLIEAYFTDGTPARAARVTVQPESAGGVGPTLFEGSTDHEGEIRVPPFDVTVRIVVEDGSGHRGEATLERSAVTASPGTPATSRLGPLWLRILLGLGIVAGLAWILLAALRRRRTAHVR